VIACNRLHTPWSCAGFGESGGALAGIPTYRGTTNDPGPFARSSRSIIERTLDRERDDG